MAEPSPTPASDQRTWQVLAHASAFIQFVSIPSFFGPLVVWLMKRDDPEVEPHAREALNFQLSLIIYFAAAVVIGIVLVLSIAGIVLIPLLLLLIGVLLVAEIIFAILGTLAASRGELYRYPLSLRLIKG
ncbi:MAG TPA: DUF4870 domain-containing protein [Acidimicrobiia bacterium]|nr:DUF4870 domain-containing protein [Acidimicrobiia bacterium]